MRPIIFTLFILSIFSSTILSQSCNPIEDSYYGSGNGFDGSFEGSLYIGGWDVIDVNNPALPLDSYEAGTNYSRYTVIPTVGDRAVASGWIGNVGTIQFSASLKLNSDSAFLSFDYRYGYQFQAATRDRAISVM